MKYFVAACRTALKSCDSLTLQDQAEVSQAVVTWEAAVGWTGDLRRRMAAEMRVMTRPTGRGSIDVYAMLTKGFW